jgi:mRNA interferase HigB
MLVTGLGQVEGFLKKAPAARGPLARWARIVETAEWKSIVDARQVMPTADLVKGTNFICFNIGGNKYRLITIVSYALQSIAVVELLTHSDYDRKY